MKLPVHYPFTVLFWPKTQIPLFMVKMCSDKKGIFMEKNENFTRFQGEISAGNLVKNYLYLVKDTDIMEKTC